MTKTKRDQTIRLPPAVVRVLRWHVETQMMNDAMQKSVLLFPGEEGGFRGPRDLFGNANVSGKQIASAFAIALPRIRTAVRRFKVPLVGRVSVAGRVSGLWADGAELKPVRTLK